MVDLAQRTSDVPVELAIDELPAFDAGVEREIIGIAQEALTNAVRHARARRIVVRAGAVRGVGFRLSVADDGRGITGDRGTAGFGMTSMRERAERIGASLTFVTARASGTEVVLAWQPAVVLDPAGGRWRPLIRGVAPARRARRATRACWSSTTTRCCAPASPTSSTRSPISRSSPRRRTAARRSTRFCVHRPDVVLMDLRMPEMEGVEAVRRIREIDPQARVVVLTTYDADEDIARALQAGAKAYILKDIAADALVACIRDVLAGKTYLAPAAAAKLAERVTQVQLTPRELAALRLMANGHSNKEIATALEISERTVKTHLGHLFEKLGSPAAPRPSASPPRRGLVRFDFVIRGRSPPDVVPYMLLCSARFAGTRSCGSPSACGSSSAFRRVLVPPRTANRSDDLSTVPAADYLVNAFDRFPLVAFSEPRHGAGGTREFLKTLVHHPRFAGTVNDIVVEFGNARYQALADRYVFGEPVARDELKQIWENTTIVTGVWTAPMYEGMLADVRALNGSLPPSRRVRVAARRPADRLERRERPGRRGHERLARRAFRVGGRRAGHEEAPPRPDLDWRRAPQPPGAVSRQPDSPPGPALSESDARRAVDRPAGRGSRDRRSSWRVAIADAAAPVKDTWFGQPRRSAVSGGGCRPAPSSRTWTWPSSGSSRQAGPTRDLASMPSRRGHRTAAAPAACRGDDRISRRQDSFRGAASRL